MTKRIIDPTEKNKILKKAVLVLLLNSTQHLRNKNLILRE